MQTDYASTQVLYDRRQVFRPFLESLNSIAPAQELFERGLIVTRPSDPHDSTQPPIHEVFADTAELNRGAQMALVGGIGSGKTTEILLTEKALNRHADAVNVSVDLAEYTDLSALNPGAILATLGLRLYPRLKKDGLTTEAIDAAHSELRQLALPRSVYVSPEQLEDDREYDGMVLVETPGLMRLRFPALKGHVKEVMGLALKIAEPLVKNNFQITFLVDGLDRLIDPAKFREFAEQDLRALRGTKITVVVVAPLLLLYDKSRFLQEYFDPVKHIPAGSTDPAFLRQILERRGALDLMNSSEVNLIAKFSGGVVRDLLTLASSAAAYAYRENLDKIGSRHVRAAVQQLGNRYLMGLGSTYRRRLRLLSENDRFSIDDPESLELLAGGQVIECFGRGRASFKVHPALTKVLTKAKTA